MSHAREVLVEMCVGDGCGHFGRVLGYAPRVRPEPITREQSRALQAWSRAPRGLLHVLQPAGYKPRGSFARRAVPPLLKWWPTQAVRRAAQKAGRP